MSFFSSLFTPVHCEAEPSTNAEAVPSGVDGSAQGEQADNERPGSDNPRFEEIKEQAAEGQAEAAEDEEEEEPEDTAPGIREECANSKVCHSFKHHFEECAERVNSGNKHIENENCVEELFHLMHCVDACAAPKIFATLK